MSKEEIEMCKEAINLGGIAYSKGRIISNEASDDILKFIKLDVHAVSTRPCTTCRKITAMLGEPFWCIRFALSEVKPIREFKNG